MLHGLVDIEEYKCNLCDFFDEDILWFFSICVEDFKCVAKVTECRAKQAIHICTYELQNV